MILHGKMCFYVRHKLMCWHMRCMNQHMLMSFKACSIYLMFRIWRALRSTHRRKFSSMSRHMLLMCRHITYIGQHIWCISPKFHDFFKSFAFILPPTCILINTSYMHHSKMSKTWKIQRKISPSSISRCMSITITHNHSSCVTSRFKIDNVQFRLV